MLKLLLAKFASGEPFGTRLAAIAGCIFAVGLTAWLYHAFPRRRRLTAALLIGGGVASMLPVVFTMWGGMPDLAHEFGVMFAILFWAGMGCVGVGILLLSRMAREGGDEPSSTPGGFTVLTKESRRHD